MKYINVEKLKAEIEKRYDNMLKRAKLDLGNANYWNAKAEAYQAIYDHLDSFIQDKAAVELGNALQPLPSSWKKRPR